MRWLCVITLACASVGSAPALLASCTSAGFADEPQCTADSQCATGKVCWTGKCTDIAVVRGLEPESDGEAPPTSDDASPGKDGGSSTKDSGGTDANLPAPGMPDPLAYFPFNGDAKDATGNGHDISGPSMFTTDRFGQANQALMINGLFPSLTIPQITTPGSLTVTMWISPDGSNGIIVRTASATNGFGIGIMNGAVLAGAGSSGGQPAMAPNPLPTNTWSHIAVVVGSGQVNLYVNGAFVQSAAGTIASSTDDWNVGGSSPFGNFSGAIDDLRIYDAALTDGQVALVAQ